MSGHLKPKENRDNSLYKEMDRDVYMETERRGRHKMDKFAFVMLNYNCFEATVQCVQSLMKKLDRPDCIMIIVDNGSQDGSGKKLKKQFSGNLNIHVLLSKKNLGFSRGLNAGYRYAKLKMKCNYISLINNDTLLLSDSYCKICSRDYEKYGYAVLGPQIENTEQDSVNRNPYRAIEKNPEEMRLILKRQRRHLGLHILMASLHMRNTYLKIRNFQKNMCRKSADGKPITETCKGVVLETGLHGCWLVFSPAYVSRFDGLEEITFLYNEEWLLFHRCRENQMLMMYEPDIHIFHAQHTVLLKFSKDENDKFLHRAKAEMNSMKRVIAYIEQRKDMEQDLNGY